MSIQTNAALVLSEHSIATVRSNHINCFIKIRGDALTDDQFWPWSSIYSSQVPQLQDETSFLLQPLP